MFHFQSFSQQKALINMKNWEKQNNTQCFKWCVAREPNQVTSNPERITKISREQAESLNFDGVKFPTELKNIDKFEKNNHEIEVNVLGYKNKEFYPLRISELNRKTYVNLLLLDDKHYVLIIHLSRHLSSEVSKNTKRKFDS